MSRIDESNPRAAAAADRARPAGHDRPEDRAGALDGTDTPWDASHEGERRVDPAAAPTAGPGPREQRLTESDRRVLDERGADERRGAADPGRDPSATGAADRTASGRGATGSDGRAGDGPATLIPHDRSADYRARWESLKAGFVDEPRRAVRGADELVGQVLDEIEELFRRQRAELERDLHDDQATTEDLRLALGRYRSFFDRLLAF